MRMSISRHGMACTMLFGSLFIYGCGETAEKAPSEDCFVNSFGNREFLGTPECVAQFKTEPMSGYWVVELEYSLFYPTIEDLDRGLRDAAFSLSFLNIPTHEVRELLLSPDRKVYRVSFDGSKSEIPGIYGEEMPELRGGVVVKENFSIEDQVRDVGLVDDYGDSALN